MQKVSTQKQSQRRDRKWKRPVAALLVVFAIVCVFPFWLYHSSIPARIAFLAASDESTLVEGLHGRLASGFGFSRLLVASDHRRIDVHGFELSYRALFTAVRTGVLLVDRLKIEEAVFSEIRLEKPVYERVLDDVARLSENLGRWKLSERGRFSEIRVARVEIGQARYLATIDSEPLIVGPVVIEDFVLVRDGWRARKFQVAGANLQLEMEPADANRLNPPLRLNVQIEAEFFEAQRAALSFSKVAP